jgi:hypothetical protein
MAMSGSSGVAPSVTPVFLEDDQPFVDTSGLIAVLGHRTISALSSAGVALALVRAHAAQRGDADAIAACGDIATMIDDAARAARDRLVLRAAAMQRHPSAAQAADVVDIRAS